MTFYDAPCNTQLGCFATPRIKENFGRADPVTGYHSISLKLSDGTRKNELVHRAVWQSFYNTAIPKNFVIMHLDDCVSNNSIKNLRLGTVKENVLQSLKNRPSTRQNPGKTKVQAIDEQGNNFFYDSMTAAATDLCVSRPTIGKILDSRPQYKYYKRCTAPDGKKFAFKKQ
jgi:hypothetical protein